MVQRSIADTADTDSTYIPDAGSRDAAGSNTAEPVDYIEKIYRRRVIPAECLLLKDDIIVHQDSEVVITKWNTLNPKTSFSHGSSCYFLRDGIKLSKMYRSDNTLFRWYCDIVGYTYSLPDRSLIVTDLLADVIVHPEGAVKVVDLDELAEAMEQNLITKEQTAHCLRSLNRLLSLIYQGRFGDLQNRLNSLRL